jgi:eukaryotic-like serine/threonine-protein kinase
MAILSGKRLGPYEILSAIGAGGMGEVYRARDTRLDRTVAIKILPDHLPSRAELRERFEREARTIASLNHPHICTLYDIGHQDGIDYLVMEYLEGETLAERLKKGPLPLQQVLQYAIEIADALDKAHRKGITHRDLKPGNIMLTKSGTKLLDFGLAKLQQETQPNIPLSQLPTAKDAITAQGTILGTLQYMAPEQIEGKTDQIDARTDIFAFGVVVYEMATGKKAFEGKTQASLIAKILETDPPLISSLQPLTPPAFDRVVRTCLTKDPADRWQTASDLHRELRWIADEAGQRAAPVAAAAARTGQRWLVISALACVFAAAVAGLAVWMLRPVPTKPVSRLTISLPPGQHLDTSRSAVAISPDGTRLVYSAAYSAGPSQTNSQLYIRMMDGLEAHAIAGTEGGGNAFFSPDGQWLGFSAGGRLMKVSLGGGAPVSLMPVAGGYVGLRWSTQGKIAVALTGGPIQQIPDTGGNPKPLTRLERDEGSHRWPEFLSGGKALLFVSTEGPTSTKIFAQSLQSGKRRELVQGGSFPRYSPSGHLVYLQGTSLMAAPFDPDRLAITGPSVPVVEGVLVSSTLAYSQYDFSSTGSLVYAPGSIQAKGLKLVWVDRTGAEQLLPAPAHNYVLPKVSPDGKRVAVGIEEGDSQIWLYDLGRDTLTRLTFEGRSNIDPLWTQDGKRIVFKGVANRLFWQPADGSAGAEALTTSELATNNVPGSWTPDGQVLAFMEVNPNTGFDLYTLSLKDGKPQPFIRTQALETAPRFSPDGRFIAYTSDESGRLEIYVRPYPGPGGKWQISIDGGTEPVWNPKGRELFYRNGNKMMAVDVSTQSTFSAGKPKMLFEGPYVPTPRSFPDYDVFPDGQRFLMLKADTQAQAPAQINVVLNWFEELKQKVPTGKK